MRGGEDGEPPSPLPKAKEGAQTDSSSQDEKSLDRKNLHFI